MVSNNRESDLVLVDYQALIDDASSPFLLNSIETAFGAEGIGIIGIRNVPNFIALKDQVLHQAHPLAHLPEESLKELEDPDSMYNSGWSHGKEMLKPGTPDLAKGSFYFNPIIDVPRPEDQQAYPLSYPINKWPRSNLSELEPACKTLGKLMKDVAVKISKHIDNFARIKNPNCQEGIRDKLVHTEKVKGRLLYYFPLSSNTEKNQSEDSWIGKNT
jgi:isopenicillin N synthase-like dioxygenase